MGDRIAVVTSVGACSFGELAASGWLKDRYIVTQGLVVTRGLEGWFH